jgi:cellobionic acid phosphorylase
VYNHAAAFYAWALYGINENDRAYSTLRKMIPGPDEADLLQRGQLPIFIPNYYRGGYGIKNLDRTAGRSSQLFNTGTVSWVYRCYIEGLCGLRGAREGLHVEPKMPSEWEGMKVVRQFRGATFEIAVERADVEKTEVVSEGKRADGNIIRDVKEGRTYKVEVRVPRAKK